MHRVSPARFFAAALLTVTVGAAPSFAEQGPVGTAAADSLGRKIILAAPARRIVSLSPGATEALFAIGAGDGVVGDTSDCDYPPQTADLPIVGGPAVASISVEKIRLLRPDLVVTAGESQAPIQAALGRALGRLGIPVFVYRPSSFVGIADAMMSLGLLAGRKNEAVRAAAALTTAVDSVRAVTGNLPSSRRPGVFWEVSGDPLTTCGASSLQHAIIEAAGGRDLFGDRSGTGVEVTAEEVRARSPQFIVGPDKGNGKADPGGIIAAVHDKRVILFPTTLVARAGPRVAAGLLALARALHPELVP